MNDDMPAVFDPNTIEAFPPRTNEDSVGEDLGTTKKITNPAAENTERAESPKAPSLDLKEKEDQQTEMQRQPTKPDAIDDFIESAMGIKIIPTNIKPEAESTQIAKSLFRPSLELKNNEDQKTPKKRQLSPIKSDSSWTPKRHQRSPKKATDVVDPKPRITRSASESTIKHPQPERTRRAEPRTETKETEEEDRMTPSTSAQTKVVAEELVPKLVQQAEATEKEDENVKASGAPVTNVLHQPTLSSMLKRKTEPEKLS
jgi:hypothetical protein